MLELTRGWIPLQHACKNLTNHIPVRNSWNGYTCTVVIVQADMNERILFLRLQFTTTTIVFWILYYLSFVDSADPKGYLKTASKLEDPKDRQWLGIAGRVIFPFFLSVLIFFEPFGVI